MSTVVHPLVLSPQSGRGPERGTWRAYKAEAAPHRTVVRVRCPQDGALISLRDHSITDEGFVQPSVTCPCGFSEFVRLDQFGAEEETPCA